jgi:hypothetical protein
MTVPGMSSFLASSAIAEYFTNTLWVADYSSLRRLNPKASFRPVRCHIYYYRTGFMPETTEGMANMIRPFTDLVNTRWGYDVVMPLSVSSAESPQSTFCRVHNDESG